MGAFGVEIPDNINEIHAAETEKDSAPEQEAPAKEAAPVESLTKEEVIELEKLAKFKFGGQEMTLKDLQNLTLMRKDYTQKTQEAAEARKYVDNFDIDLDKVIENPSLLKQFKEIYPASLAEKAEKIVNRIWRDNPDARNEAPKPQTQNSSLPPEILAKLDKIDRLEKWQLGQEEQIQQEKVSIIEKQLDDWFTDLSGKYKFADPDAVLTKAQALAESGHTVDKTSLERIFQEKDAFNQKAWAESQKTKQQEQLKVAAKAKESGKGGDTPSAAPKQAKSLKEVRQSLLREFD